LLLQPHTPLIYSMALSCRSKKLVQRSKINTINLHKEISASLCPAVGWRHEMNNPIRVIQVTRGLGGSPHRFPIMACYLHRRRVVYFLLFVTDTKWVVTESQVISFQGMKEEGWREEEEGVEGDRLHHLLFPKGKAKRNRPLWHNTMYLVSDCHFIIYPRVRSVIWRPVAH